MKWVNSIIPFKIVSAIFSPLIVLLTISLGGGASEVSFVFSSLTFGSLLGSLIWGNISFRTAHRRRIFILGFFGLTLSTFLLLFVKEIILIIFIAFIFSFLTTATLFAALAMIAHRYKKITKAIGNFEKVGGWAWVVGLIIGFFITSFLSAREILVFLFLISLISLFYVFYVFKRKFLEKFAEDMMKDFGLLTWVEKGIEIASRQERKLMRILTAFPHVTRSAFPLISIIIPKFPRRHFLLHFTFFLLFLSFGLAFSQQITLIKEKGFTDNIVFLVSLISSIMAAIFYSKVYTVENLKDVLTKMFGIRIFMFILLTISVSLSDLPFLFISIIFSLLDGFSWAYIVILSNSMMIKISRTEVGINNFFRSIGYIVGSFISGVLVNEFGFATNFFLAVVLSSLSLFSFISVKI
ncbi:MAG TPA: MFS transporter [Candidatus Aenigmarchaeota archaeon]|nr:MFS transporter [Candidatus Aenigmarchaeota archaeon]